MKLLLENWRGYLTEIRKGLWRDLTTQSPVSAWPEYVVKEVVYNAIKSGDSLEDIKNFIKEDFGYETLEEIRWELKNVPINIDSFDDFTQDRLNKRLSGPEWAEQAGMPRDAERLDIQKKFAQETGAPSKEPVIMMEMADGRYQLLEGWHRTLTYLSSWDNYNQPAWIARSQK